MYTEGAKGVVVGAYDVDGVFFPLDSIKQKYNYNAEGKVTSIVASRGEYRWTQTFTYVNSKLDNVSDWVKTKVAA